MQEYIIRSPYDEYCDELTRSKLDWVQDVPCAAQGPSRMYPASEAGQKIIANEVCKGCVAQTQCLNLALVSKEDYGVWGGTTEQERKTLRKTLSEKLSLSNKNIWGKKDIRQAVWSVAEEFVKRHNADQKEAVN